MIKISRNWIVCGIGFYYGVIIDQNSKNIYFNSSVYVNGIYYFFNISIKKSDKYIRK